MATRVKTERNGRVLTVTLDNPPRNFLDTRMVLELYELMRSLKSDRSIGALVITGAHPSAFVTHYQVAEILAGAEATPRAPAPVLGAVLRAVGALGHLPGVPNALIRSRLAGMLILWRVHQVYLQMNRSDKVFVAAINGFTAAGGCELALACDVRLAADGDFRIGMIEPLLGFNPGGSGGQRLTRAVGPGRAVEMMLESHMYTPSEALAAGLVHRVVPAERLLEEAHATQRGWLGARQLLSGPSSVPRTKAFRVAGREVCISTAVALLTARRGLRQKRRCESSSSKSRRFHPRLLHHLGPTMRCCVLGRTGRLQTSRCEHARAV